MTPSPPSNGALTAFLRGVERRGLVFAELQGGDVDRGDAALAAALRAFAAAAGQAPFAEWPRRFWSLLLAAPALRGATLVLPRADALAVLAGLGSGPRAALLLRLVAGLSEGDAAAVLGISRPTYRLALQRALPRDAEGRVDPELWRALGDTAQQAIRALPAMRLERLAALREGRPVHRDRQPAASGTRRRWLWPALSLAALLTALALAATWWWPETRTSTDSARIRSEPLPPAAEPAARYDAGDALATHRDLALLLDAASPDAPPRDPAFDAWLVSAIATPAADGDATD